MNEAFMLLRDLVMGFWGAVGWQLRSAISVGIPDEDASRI